MKGSLSKPMAWFILWHRRILNLVKQIKSKWYSKKLKLSQYNNWKCKLQEKVRHYSFQQIEYSQSGEKLEIVNNFRGNLKTLRAGYLIPIEIWKE